MIVTIPVTYPVLDLAVAIGGFALAMGELAESDLDKQLRQVLGTLSSVEKRAQDLQHTQAQEDTITFMATGEYTRGSVCLWLTDTQLRNILVLSTPLG